MTEQRVTLETAKLAKEKGFNIDSKYYISVNDGNYVFDFSQGLKTKLKLIHQPTQSLLQKWIREEKKIYVSPKESWSFDNILEFVCFVNGSIVNHDDPNKPINRFDTYELALEAGLQEALKLIPEKK